MKSVYGVAEEVENKESSAFLLDFFVVATVQISNHFSSDLRLIADLGL